MNKINIGCIILWIVFFFSCKNDVKKEYLTVVNICTGNDTIELKRQSRNFIIDTLLLKTPTLNKKIGLQESSSRTYVYADGIFYYVANNNKILAFNVFTEEIVDTLMNQDFYTSLIYIVDENGLLFWGARKVTFYDIDTKLKFDIQGENLPSWYNIIYQEGILYVSGVENEKGDSSKVVAYSLNNGDMLWESDYYKNHTTHEDFYANKEELFLSIYRKPDNYDIYIYDKQNGSIKKKRVTEKIKSNNLQKSIPPVSECLIR